jgi:hypothetical protein
MKPIGPLALLLCAGCLQEIDLGRLRPLLGDAGVTGSLGVSPLPPPVALPAQPRCPLEDPADLPVPPRCIPYDNGGIVRELCFATGDGRVLPPQDGVHLQHLPACPVGVFFGIRDADGDAQALERAVVVLKGEEDDKRAFAVGTGTPLPRTVEVLPARGGLFVRLDPRPSDGLRVNVLLRYQEISPGAVYGFVAGFIAGERAIR